MELRNCGYPHYKYIKRGLFEKYHRKYVKCSLISNKGLKFALNQIFKYLLILK